MVELYSLTYLFCLEPHELKNDLSDLKLIFFLRTKNGSFMEESIGPAPTSLRTTRPSNFFHAVTPVCKMISPFLSLRLSDVNP